MKRFLALWVAPVALVAAAAIWPLATGERTLILRDVLNTHLSLRSYLAESIRAFELPLIDPLRAGGQGLLGNPNALPLYPDNLLLFVSSTLWQLNAHFWLHALAALGAMYWLGRRWGLAREGAWAAAVTFASSGYFLSQMNLYNAVAGVALAPAVAAALLATGEPAHRSRALAALGGLWALELLAGDPLLAALALGWAVLLAWPRRREIPGRRAAGALALGTLVAAPQIVEMLRLLPGSYRGFWGYDPLSLVKTTPDPRALLDLLLPLFFGRPDEIGSWSDAYFGGAPPLYYSLAPGLVALAAIVAGARAGEPRTRWATILLGLGLLLGCSRPWAGWLLAHLPGGGLFRFPVKTVLGAALGASLLAGRGVERLLGGGERDWARALALLAAAQGTFFLLFALPGNVLERPFRALFVAGVGDGLFAALRRGWAGTALLGGALALLAWAIVRFGRRDRTMAAVAGATLVALQAASQLLFLHGLLPTDQAAIYRRPPEILAELPQEAVLAHGGTADMLVDDYPMSPRLPDRRSFWLWRRAHAEAFGFAGLAAGRRYELDVSAEGLDSFLAQAVALGLRQFDDPQRIALLAATGVDVLLAPRPLAIEALGAARLLRRTDAADPLYLYGIAAPLADAQLLGDVRFAPSVNAGLEAVFAPGFDPRRSAVVAGEGEARRAPAGTVHLLRFAPERIELEAESPSGGFVVVRRAWLPIWRVEVDGAPAKVRIADLTRLAVELPAGRHRVRFSIDRRPLLAAGAIALAAAAALFALARRGAPAA